MKEVEKMVKEWLLGTEASEMPEYTLVLLGILIASATLWFTLGNKIADKLQKVIDFLT